MTPYSLKRSILKRAFEGLMVSKNDCEGSGYDFVEANNRARMSLPKQEQNKIGNRIKINPSGRDILEIPDHWTWEAFGNLVINYDSERRPITKSVRATGKYPYYGATGQIDSVANYLFDGQFLMIGEDGGNFFVDRDNSFISNGRFWANNHVHVVKPILCDIHYLKHFLDFCDFAKMGLINGIAVPKLNQASLNSFWYLCRR